MKLAEALMLRADLQKKLGSLKQRITANVLVQEGNAPHEDPAKLFAEAAAVQSELETLVLAINRANHAFRIADGRTLADAIARRETLIARHALLVAAIAATHKEPDRYSMKEIKWVVTLPVAGMQKQADDLAKTIRELNVTIQAANWQAEAA